jgi:glycosyltransferase involved in cell wall biosynthesis
MSGNIDSLQLARHSFMKRLRIGYYMYTPMIGGAEGYLKDLLWLHDRERFEVTLFYEPWPDFERFLELERCEGIHPRPVPVFEASGHTAVNWKENSAEVSPVARNGVEMKTRLKRAAKSVPFSRAVAAHVMRSLNFAFWSKNRASLKAALSETPIDLLHVVNGGYPGATTGLIAATVARELNIPCLMTISGTPVFPNAPVSFARKIDKLVFEGVDRFVIISDLMGRQLTERRGFDPAKFHKIFWGVRAPEFTNGSINETVDETRASLGIPADGIVIGSVSRFTPLKGQEYLVDAVSLLRPQFSNLHLVLVGDGPTRTTIEQRAADKGIAAITTFAGQYNNEQVFRVLRAFDVFVHASEAEGLPYVVLEAMSQRRVVVATDVGGTSEAVLDGETGLLIPAGDPQRLADAIRRVITDPSRSEQMAKRGYEHFRENFTVELMVKKHESLYEQVIKEHRG